MALDALVGSRCRDWHRIDGARLRRECCQPLVRCEEGASHWNAHRSICDWTAHLLAIALITCNTSRMEDSWTYSWLRITRTRPVDLPLPERESTIDWVSPYGASPDWIAPVIPKRNAAKEAINSLRDASKKRDFWYLTLSFLVCGLSTSGLVGTHFIPASHDHGMSEVTAASLLALIGVFDVVGTILSGYLTDRVDPRKLLFFYYFFRGLSLFLLPSILFSTLHASTLVFIIFYGLDWVATVPPTIVLCRTVLGQIVQPLFMDGYSQRTRSVDLLLLLAQRSCV